MEGEDFTALDDFTTNELLAVVKARVEGRRLALGGANAAAARDFSVSITALEDAATRYNSGRYRERGTWVRSDPDKDERM